MSFFLYVSITLCFFTKALSAVVITSWLVCASLPPTREREQPQSNWTSADAPCAKFENVRKPLLRDIGVKIDAAEAWTDAFRRALRFWNTVLEANFHEETDLSACSVRVIDHNPDSLGHAVAARSQVTSLANFSGKIAVSQKAAKEMDRSEVYAAAVHEIGHLLGLKHNTNIHSVMYFLDVDGSGALDDKDILDLSQRHQLRTAIFAKGFVPIQTSSIEIASKRMPERSVPADALIPVAVSEQMPDPQSKVASLTGNCRWPEGNSTLLCACNRSKLRGSRGQFQETR